MPIASSVFLGLELAVSQRNRSPIIDDSLELVVFETQGGSFTTPGVSHMTPTPFSKDLERTYDLNRIKSIGGSAQYALALFSLPSTFIIQNVSSHIHALTIEALLGNLDHFFCGYGLGSYWLWAARVFLASFIAGKWIPELCVSGTWSHTARQWVENRRGSHNGRRIRWSTYTTVDVYEDGSAMSIRAAVDAVLGLSDVTTYGLAAYFSVTSQPSDVVLLFNPMDVMMAPAQHHIPTRLTLPRSAAVLTNHNADVPRALVRDLYTESWSAFDRLVAIVPPGGSIDWTTNSSPSGTYKVTPTHSPTSKHQDHRATRWRLSQDKNIFSSVCGMWNGKMPTTLSSHASSPRFLPIVASSASIAFRTIPRAAPRTVPHLPPPVAVVWPSITRL
ncbi:hypothetical protein R3P38DRAFT_3209264 [Favolaschia claudopus]|uniref:Uncharacterized protein n=1 Tax=Favolaschia claudopus TaxID=2862362 RepID=A0AAW0AI03_9AGAR